MDKAQIRDIFMRNGFTIKDGQSDLRDYVYAAAEELVAAARAEAEPVAEVTKRGEHWLDKWFVEAIQALPDGTHKLYAAPPAPSVSDDTPASIQWAAHELVERAAHAGVNLEIARVSCWPWETGNHKAEINVWPLRKFTRPQ